MLRETDLRAEHLILPLFVSYRSDLKEPIRSLPGQFQVGVERLHEIVQPAVDAGVHSVLLFGIPEEKDEQGSGAWDGAGPVPQAIRLIRKQWPQLVIVADVCLCEYTTHGHCGKLDSTSCIDIDATLPLLARTAVAYAAAGAHVVAPSAMVDGQVGVIRAALDEENRRDIAIMSYSSKFASAYYGPFREAVATSLVSGDRAAHQLPVASAREAMRESARDEREGADMLMVKPAGAYLDILARLRQRTDVPIAAYQVSGEYAMIKAASERGWVDERLTAIESLIAIRRAGADVIITYYATTAAEWLRDRP